MTLYDIMKDEKKTDDFLKKVNDILKDDLSKEKYKTIIKDKNIIGWFIARKIYSIRPGLYDLDYKYKKDIVFDAPIVNFLRTENVILTCKDSIKLYNEHTENKESFIFMDPPYLQSCNDFYTDEKNFNIYEHVSNNNFENKPAYIAFCLENNWIIKLLFKGKNNITYDKKYETTKKLITHIIIDNTKK